LIDVDDLRELVIRPTLDHLRMHSEAAENLLVGTALHESDLTFLEQNGGGPARGIYQIEPDTLDDLHENYLSYRPDLMTKLETIRGSGTTRLMSITGNLFYATAVARLIYYRKRPPLPRGDDITGLAHYWKRWYNTPSGKGRVEDWIQSYEEYG
jgi:hypothetical protein